ncbi:WD40-repeat-containing domain protein, partial [Daedaleopsis nitida]
VCIWHVNDGKLRHRVIGQSPVILLLWVASGEEVVLFGTKDGNITMLTISTALNDLTVRGFWAHRYPVEKLATVGNCVASGAFHELKIWHWRTIGACSLRFVLERKLPKPPPSPYNKHREVLVTGLHWMGTDHRPCLVVSYMYHGIQVFDPTTGQSGADHIFPRQDVRSIASLSPDGSLLAVGNLTTGFNVYRMDTPEPVRHYKHVVGKPQPTPVLFIHSGHAIVGGSTVGKVDMWDLTLGKLHTLSIPGMLPNVALSSRLQIFLGDNCVLVLSVSLCVNALHLATHHMSRRIVTLLLPFQDTAT